MNVNAFLQKDYENKPPSLPKKQSQSKLVLSAACPELAEALSAAEGVVEWVEWANFRKAKTNIKSLAGKSDHTRKNGKNLDSGLSLIFLSTIFNMAGKRQRFGFPQLYLRLPVQESTGAGTAGSFYRSRGY